MEDIKTTQTHQGGSETATSTASEEACNKACLDETSIGAAVLKEDTPQMPSANPSLQDLEAMDSEALDEAGYVKVDLSELPAINWGALFMPAVWGPAHGSWLTILFYPLWIFADNCLVSGIQYGGVAAVASAVVFLGTAAVMIMYARTAGQKAYLRVAHKLTMQQYLKRERIWTFVSLAIALVFIGFATWYNLSYTLPLAG